MVFFFLVIWRCWEGLNRLHPEESAGGVLAELELGDLVAVRGIGVSFRAVFPPHDWFSEAHT